MSTRSGNAIIAIAVAVAVFASKLPWVFTTLGEQDHGRFILAAMIYAQDGAQTIRPYAMLTSPLWTLPMSWLSQAWTAPQLVLFSNVVGWLAGAAVAALGYVLLRQLHVSRAWSTAGALALTWLPGPFYASLYGYPSQWALPFLLAAASTFLCALDAADRRSRVLWLVACGICYCLLVLIKVDFALTGTLLPALAVVRWRLLHPATLTLPALALVTAILVLGVSRLLIEQTYGDFASGWTSLYPGRVNPLDDPFSVTTLYSVGLGTTIALAAAAALGLLRTTTRVQAARLFLAWAVAVLPLWLFWMVRPPMSARHALPGAVLTALFAAALASAHLARRPLWAPLWLVAVLGCNALLGQPDFDFNYRPSGKVVAGARMNRQAFAVGDSIAAAIAAPADRTKVLLGEPDPQVLGGIDLLPLVEYAMASGATQVRCLGRITGPDDPHMRDLVFTRRDGQQTRLLRYIEPRRVGFYRGPGVGFYAPWGLQGAEVNVMGVSVVEFDPEGMLHEYFGVKESPDHD